MNAEELMKQSYPTIEFEDKWDYLTQRFSADDMIHFAELYAKTKANGIERSSDKCHIQNVTHSALFDASKAILDNIETWLDTGNPADSKTSKMLYDNLKKVVVDFEHCH